MFREHFDWLEVLGKETNSGLFSIFVFEFHAMIWSPKLAEYNKYLTLTTLSSSSSTAGLNICIRPSASAFWLASLDGFLSFSFKSIPTSAAILEPQINKVVSGEVIFGTSLSFVGRVCDHWTLLTHSFSTSRFKSKNMAFLSLLRRNVGLGLQVWW